MPVLHQNDGIPNLTTTNCSRTRATQAQAWGVVIALSTLVARAVVLARSTAVLLQV